MEAHLRADIQLAFDLASSEQSCSQKQLSAVPEIKELTCNTRLLDFSRMLWLSGSWRLVPGPTGSLRLSWPCETTGELREVKGRKGLLSFWLKYFWISSSSLRFFLGKGEGDRGHHSHYKTLHVTLEQGCILLPWLSTVQTHCSLQPVFYSSPSHCQSQLCPLCLTRSFDT